MQQGDQHASCVLSTDTDQLKQMLLADQQFLIIQDLDGVCMPLVKNPLTRMLSPAYILAAKRLAGRFFVLTNGEHVGPTGLQGILTRAVGDAALLAQSALYLPGLGAGGIQWQAPDGRLSSPGVSEPEQDFFARGACALKKALLPVLLAEPFNLTSRAVAELLSVIVLENPFSPTVNINAAAALWQNDVAQSVALQQAVQQIMQMVLREAEAYGLKNAFFLHYAPNLGSDAHGERIKWAKPGDLGTTDFQCMLRGARKEVGVLVILNHYYFAQTGSYPLGANFSVRDAPETASAMVQLARDVFDPALMPLLVGVGDTVTSHQQGAQGPFYRGGSDRGFLTLIQQLGEAFNRQAVTVFVDSSGDELQRPSVSVDRLSAVPPCWSGVAGITDPADPLCLNYIFAHGYAQYCAFFCDLAQAMAS